MQKQKCCFVVQRSSALFCSQRKFVDTAPPLYVTSSHIEWHSYLTVFLFYSSNRNIQAWHKKLDRICWFVFHSCESGCYFSWPRLYWPQFGKEDNLRQFQIAETDTEGKNKKQFRYPKASVLKPYIKYRCSLQWCLLFSCYHMWLEEKCVEKEKWPSWPIKKHIIPYLCVQVPVLNWDVNLVFGIWGVNPNLIKSSRESEYI